MRAPAEPLDGPADLAAARALARQKTLAAALVVACAVVYAGAKALEGRQAAMPYLAAFAEAAIVGALADWYAVTALFRHPLGLRLPHTAIIPANQARIADAIGEFIARHFLTGSQVAARILEFDPAASIGRWLGEPATRTQVAAHGARMLPDAIGAIDRETLRSEIERGVTERLATVDLGHVIGTSLEAITRDQRHHAVLDELLARIETRLADPSALNAMRARIRAELPSLFRFFLADSYLLQRLLRAGHALITDVRQDRGHGLRVELDALIAEFIGNLRNSPDHRERLETLKQDLLARVELRDILIEGLERLIAFLRADTEREDGIIRRGLGLFLDDLAQRLQHDRDLRARLNHWLAEAAASLTEHHRHDVALFVAAQVKSWDARHAVRTIELSIGKDLQFIRVNGTLVGGLIGLAIFAATRLALR
jgi:uncharacterized membrane-anchored protein YjiN (DUF445 family)